MTARISVALLLVAAYLTLGTYVLGVQNPTPRLTASHPDCVSACLERCIPACGGTP